MQNKKIALSFVQVSPQEFEINLFVRKLNELSSEDQGKHLIRRLNEPNESNSFEKYAVSFIETPEFEHRVVNSSFDRDITKSFLLNSLSEHVSGTGLKTYNVTRDKYKRIYLTLAEHREGTETIWLEPYYLQKKQVFGFLLDYKFRVGEEYKTEIVGNVDKKILQLSGTLDQKGHSNKAFYQFKYDKLKLFFAHLFPHLQSFTGGDVVFNISTSLFELNAHSLNSKTYQFFDDKENSSAYLGLRHHFPFQKPDIKTDFLFVFRDADRMFAINLLNGLKGITTPSTFPGMESLFRIQFNNDNIKGKKVAELDSEVFDEIISEILNLRLQGVNLLPILITNSNETPEDDKLYTTIKHSFVSKNIPCQVVTRDLISNSNVLKYSLSNIGLQIFAKAGGKPWKVKPAVKKCLIVGIGSKNKINTFIDEQGNSTKRTEKFLTYSVLTDSSGLFKEIKLLSDTDNEEDYYTSIISKLSVIIEKAIDEGYKDIVIHCPFRISKRKVWDKLFSAFENTTRISVILVNDKHKFFAYDFTKNALVPYESTFTKLSESEYLVWFEGLQYNNAPFSRPVGGPVFIEFWYSNNRDLFGDPNYKKDLLQDCINLSGANWKGFKAKQLPVSIYYCQEIAKFLKKFEDYHFDHVEVQNLKPWFL